MVVDALSQGVEFVLRSALLRIPIGNIRLGISNLRILIVIGQTGLRLSEVMMIVVMLFVGQMIIRMRDSLVGRLVVVLAEL